MTRIRFVPDASGERLPDITLCDLSFYHISQAGWLKLELRNAENPHYAETRFYPPDRIESVIETGL